METEVTLSGDITGVRKTNIYFCNFFILIYFQIYKNITRVVQRDSTSSFIRLSVYILPHLLYHLLSIY